MDRQEEVVYTLTLLTNTGVGRKKTARLAGYMRMFTLLEDGAEINAF